MTPVIVVLSAALPCLAADVQLPLGPYARPGEYVAVEVSGASGVSGVAEHELSGPQVLPVRWKGEEGSDSVVLPVLVLPSIGSTLAVDIDGERKELPVQVLGPGDRLIVDTTESMSDDALRRLGGVLFPEDQIFPARAAFNGPPVAWRTADAVVVDPNRQEQLIVKLARVGVTLVAVGDVPGDAWQRIGERVWRLVPPSAPAELVYSPSAYGAIQAWQPGRPAGEKLVLAIVAPAFAAAVLILVVAIRRPRRQLLAVGGLAGVATGGLVAWMILRPQVAIRQADIQITRMAGDDVSGFPQRSVFDRWLLLGAPAAGPMQVRVAFVGVTYPAAFSASHLQSLAPSLACDAEGNPLFWRLTLPSPRYQAAVVQRTFEGRSESQFAPWARPIVRDVYLRRMHDARWDMEEDRAVITRGDPTATR